MWLFNQSSEDRGNLTCWRPLLLGTKLESQVRTGSYSLHPAPPPRVYHAAVVVPNARGFDEILIIFGGLGMLLGQKESRSEGVV